MFLPDNSHGRASRLLKLKENVAEKDNAQAAEASAWKPAGQVTLL
jgi:hypothetical protein